MGRDDYALVRLQISHALLLVIDALSAEFPDLSSAAVYVAVGDCRLVAARQLPDVVGYQKVLEVEARTRLLRERGDAQYELSAGTSRVG
jgi:hypothetical protein